MVWYGMLPKKALMLSTKIGIALNVISVSIIVYAGVSRNWVRIQPDSQNIQNFININDQKIHWGLYKYCLVTSVYNVEICKWMTAASDGVKTDNLMVQMDVKNRAFHVYNMWTLPICLVLVLTSTACLAFGQKQDKLRNSGFFVQFIAGVMVVIGGSIYIRNFNELVKASQVNMFGFDNSFFQKINGEIMSAAKIGWACYLYLASGCVSSLFSVVMLGSNFLTFGGETRNAGQRVESAYDGYGRGKLTTRNV